MNSTNGEVKDLNLSKILAEALKAAGYDVDPARVKVQIKSSRAGGRERSPECSLFSVNGIHLHYRLTATAAYVVVRVQLFMNASLPMLTMTEYRVECARMGTGPGYPAKGREPDNGISYFTEFVTNLVEQITNIRVAIRRTLNTSNAKDLFIAPLSDGGKEKFIRDAVEAFRPVGEKAGESARIARQRSDALKAERKRNSKLAKMLEEGQATKLPQEL